MIRLSCVYRMRERVALLICNRPYIVGPTRLFRQLSATQFRKLSLCQQTYRSPAVAYPSTNALPPCYVFLYQFLATGSAAKRVGRNSTETTRLRHSRTLCSLYSTPGIRWFRTNTRRSSRTAKGADSDSVTD